MFLYFCAISGNATNQGFDYVFLRVTFFLYVGTWVLDLISKRKRIALNYYVLWVGAFAGFYFASYIWAKNINSCSTYANKFMRFFVLAIVLVNIIKSNKDIEKILKMLLASLAYASILLVLKTPFSDFGNERIGQMIGLNSNDLGFRLATAIAICIFFIANKHVKNKLIYVILAIAFSVLTLFTGSRKALLMVIFLIFTFAVLYRNHNRDNKDIIKKIIFIIIILISIYILWYLMMNVDLFYNVLGHRMESMINTFWGDADDTSMANRDFYREKAIELFKLHPVLGYGGNNFHDYMHEIDAGIYAYSHNNFWELMSTLGIVGTSIYYIPLAFFTWKLMKSFLITRESLSLMLLTLVLFVFVTTRYGMYYNGEFYYLFFTLVYMYNIFAKKGMDLSNENTKSTQES